MGVGVSSPWPCIVSRARAHLVELGHDRVVHKVDEALADVGDLGLALAVAVEDEGQAAANEDGEGASWAEEASSVGAVRGRGEVGMVSGRY